MEYWKELKEDDLQAVTGGSVDSDMSFTCGDCSKKFYYSFGGEDEPLATWAYHYHIRCKHNPNHYVDDSELTEQQKSLAIQLYDPEN